MRKPQTLVEKIAGITDPQKLAKLAQDKFADVRETVARNPHTPADALEELSHDTSAFVRMSVAANPSTPPEILKGYADGFNKELAGIAAANPNFPSPTQGEIRISLRTDGTFVCRIGDMAPIHLQKEEDIESSIRDWLGHLKQGANELNSGVKL